MLTVNQPALTPGCSKYQSLSRGADGIEVPEATAMRRRLCTRWAGKEGGECPLFRQCLRATHSATVRVPCVAG
jgi:hypothetical protein